MSGWTYAKSGVNIDQKSSAIKALVDELGYKRDGIGQAVRMPGLFASLIDFGDMYITMATDGVGSKLLIAEALNKWDTVGIDCIAMNVNDTICVNAEPTSFVDYIAIDKPNDDITREVGIGLQKGAELSNMEIVGGEIAVLPELVNGLDLSGTCLGYVKKDRIITGATCAEGDLIVSLRSSGIHSNGLTLARKIVEANGLKWTDKVSGLSKSIGEELLTPTEIYVKQVLDITSKHEVHGLVDITGGGLRNILRMKEGLQYVISDPVKPAPIFKVLQEMGEVEDKEIYQTLNMSMGFTIIAPADEAEAIAKENPNAEVVGRVQKGAGVLLEPGNILYDHYRCRDWIYAPDR
ncbi:MAG: phosphoribosylformylglycinamidine cyclo-ligase [Thermoplasmata archaeon]|nr:phosphoribosylformylglycinamidine cyclo-ligase [Thermoplasmata archaeon]